LWADDLSDVIEVHPARPRSSSVTAIAYLITFSPLLGLISGLIG
jgi:hypothetical protein